MTIRDERKQQSRQALLDAALRLSTEGGSFSHLSLREVTREVGLVPSAFYRHFQDMDALGQELVDQVALNLKNLLHQLGRNTFSQAFSHPHVGVELFLQGVNHNKQEWQFMIAERWGGCAAIRSAIAREIEDLIEALSTDLKKFAMFEHTYASIDLRSGATILINMSFTWAMTWINLSAQYQGETLSEQQNKFIDHSTAQARLILNGMMDLR